MIIYTCNNIPNILKNHHLLQIILLIELISCICVYSKGNYKQTMGNFDLELTLYQNFLKTNICQDVPLIF